MNATGNLARVRNITYTWPTSQGSANQVLRNDGAGVLTWAAAAGGANQTGGGWYDRGTTVNLSNTAASVAVGNTWPSAKLHIFGSGTTSGYALRVSDSLGTDRLVVQDNGNIGIGTTAPQAAVHITSGSLVQTVGTNPRVVGTVSDAALAGKWSAVFMSGTYAYYAGATNDAIIIVDVSNVTNPVLVGGVQDSFVMSGPQALYVSGKYAYA